MLDIFNGDVPIPGAGRSIGGRRIGRTSRTLLLLLVAAIIPVLLLAAWTGFRTATQQRQAALDRARVTVGRVAERITAEMSAEVQVAETLALSSTLVRGDLASFYGEAQRLRDVRPLWYTIELDDSNGQQLLNLLRPFGTLLGSTADRASFDEALKEHRPVVGGIGPVGPISGKQLVVIRIPVTVGGILRYVVTVALNPSAVSTILRETAIPEGWVGAVVDRSGTLIARSLAEQESLGDKAGPALRSAIATSGGGFYPGTTLEGVPVEVVFRTLPQTGRLVRSPRHSERGTERAGSSCTLCGRGWRLREPRARRRPDGRGRAWHRPATPAGRTAI